MRIQQGEPAESAGGGGQNGGVQSPEGYGVAATFSVLTSIIEGIINANANVSINISVQQPARFSGPNPITHGRGLSVQAPLRLGAVGYNGRCEGRGLLERQTGFEPASSG